MTEDVYEFGPSPKPKKPGAKAKAAASKTTTATQKAESSNGVAAGQLRQLVERIERLEEEKKAIADDIKDVYGEAKSNGFDTKVLRQVVRIRKMDQAERQEQESLLDLYLGALGMGDAEAPLLDPARVEVSEGNSDD